MPLDELWDDEQIDAVVAELAARRARGEPTPNSVIREWARPCGTSPPTLRRWARLGSRPRRGGNAFSPPRKLLVRIAKKQGKVAPAVAELRDENVQLPDVRTCQRGVKRRLARGDLVFFADGFMEARKYEGTITQHINERNVFWFADFMGLHRKIKLPRVKDPVDGHAMIVTEGASGAIAGVGAVAGDFDVDDALHVVQEALRRDDRLSVVFGAPQILVHDNAAVFLSPRFAGELADPWIKTRTDPIEPYKFWLNGRVERPIGVLRGLLASPLDTRGPKDRAGQPFVPERLAAVPIQTILAELRVAAARHNRLPHRDLTDISKEEAFRRLPGEIRPVAPEVLQRYLRRKPVTVTNKMIQLDRAFFVAKQLNRLHGRTLEARYRDISDDAIEVYRAGRRLCTALNTRYLKQEEADEIALGRAADRQLRESLLAEAALESALYAKEQRETHEPTDATPPRPAGADNPWNLAPYEEGQE